MEQRQLSTELIQRVKRHEGFRSEPYVDTLGHITIGYGHKVQSVSEPEAGGQLLHDLWIARSGALQLFSPDIWPALNDIRKDVLTEMVFQLGKNGVSKFVKMKWALDKGDYQEAANQMILSRWYEQTTHRCTTLAGMMRNGLPEQ